MQRAAATDVLESAPQISASPNRPPADESRHTVRDALIVNPRPGHANSGITALATPSGETGWGLRISSDVALRYVDLRLQRSGDLDVPAGRGASVDSLGAVTITANS